MQELQKNNRPVQEAYESAQADGGLVSKIRTSTLSPAQQDILMALYEQAGRTVYKNQPVSFREKLINSYKPQHNPSLMYHSSVFLEQIVSSIQKLISNTNDSGLKKEATNFYTTIYGSIEKHLPKDTTKPQVSEEIRHLIEDFYDWHVRPTLIAAKEVLISKDQQISSQFKKDLIAVRGNMVGIYDALVQKDTYQKIA